MRVKNCSIKLDAATNKITATFNLEAGKPSVKIKEVRLYAFTDIYVGHYVKFTTAGTTHQQVFATAAAAINGSTQFTLSIDLSANSSIFKPGRNYYFRVGALGALSGVGTIRHNYAPLVKIAL